MARNEVVEVWNPAGAAPDAAVATELRFPRLAAGDRVRVAYVDNVKPNAAELMKLTDARLRATFRVESKAYRKDYGAGPARPGTYEEIAGTADLAVVGVAD